MLLRIDHLHWLSHMPEQQDLCAHGHVTVIVAGQTLSDVNSDDWCVSAAALYLLRTLDSDHTDEIFVGEHLIPHCGHTMYGNNESNDVLIEGCNRGVNWEVRHQGNTIVLRTDAGEEETIAKELWQQQVLQFSDQVEAFYANSLPKTPSDNYEQDGFAAFRSEWLRRRNTYG